MLLDWFVEVSRFFFSSQKMYTASGYVCVIVLGAALSTDPLHALKPVFLGTSAALCLEQVRDSHTLDLPLTLSVTISA